MGAGGSITVTNLSMNTGYQFLVQARNGDGVVTAYSPPSALVYTYANPAFAPSVLNATTSTLSLTINTNSNPASTTFAIYNATDSTYVDENGDASVTPVFQTAGTWGTHVVRGLAPSQLYALGVLAQNHDGVQTATSSQSSLATLAETPGNPIVNNPTVNTLDVEISSAVENGNSAGAVYAIYNVTVGAFIDSDGSTAGSEVWQTADEWDVVTVTGLSSNTSYTFRVKAKNPDDVQTDLSDPTAAYTATGNPSNFQAIIISTSTITFTLDSFANDSLGLSGYCFYTVDCDSGSGWIATSTWEATGLSLNTQYAFYAQYRNAAGIESSPTELSIYTKASNPGAPILTSLSTTTLSLEIDTNGNSTSTEYALYNTTLGSYIDASGASTGSAVWQTTSTWGGIVVTGLSPNTQYGFQVKGRNGDTSETDFGDTASAYTQAAVPGTPNTVVGSTTSLDVSWSASSNGSGTVYQLYNVTTDAVVATTTATSLSVSGLSPNVSYMFKVRAQYLSDNSTWTSYSSDSMGIYTLATVPTAPGVSNQTTTTIDIDMSGIANGNASTTAYAIYNVTASAYVDATGASTPVPVYQTTSSWSGVTVSGLTPNTLYTFQVKAKNGDDVETSFGTASSAVYTPPAQAGQPVFSDLTTSTVSLSFSANGNPGTTVYTVYNETASTVYTTTTTVSDINLTNLVPNTLYEFSIVSLHAGGGASATTSTPSSTTTPATVVGDLSATPFSTSQINLSWTSTNASGSIYSVHYGDGTFIATTTATSYPVTGLAEDTSYTFKIRVEQTGAPGTYSAYSNSATESTPLGMPLAPSDLLFSVVSTSTLTISWTDNATNEDAYIVEYGTDGVSYDTTVTTTEANVTSVSVTGLIPNTLYYFAVFVSNDAGSDSGYANTTTLASAPTNLSAIPASTSQINLSWDTANASSSVYAVHFTDGSLIATTTATTYSVTGLSENTSYTFKVRTEQTGDSGVYSAYSDTVTTSTLVGVLNAPTDVTPASVSTTTLALSWTDASSNEDAFFVSYGTDGVTFPTTATTTASGIESALVVGLTPNTQYYFIVVASNGSGTATSTPVSTTTLASAPTALSASAVSTSQINLVWSSTNPSGSVYEIRDSGDVFIATTTVTSYSVTGLSENTSYSYKVRTEQTDAPGTYSGYSNTASATTSLDGPTAPTDLLFSSVATTTLTLSWTDASGNEDSFVVAYGTDGSIYPTTVTTTAPNVTTTLVTGLTPNTQYYFIVTASNGSGTVTSTNINTTTLAAVPTSLSASVASPSQINLSWSSTNPSGSVYEIRDSGDVLIATTTVTSYSVTGLSENTSYTYKVRTQQTGDDSSYSAYSSPASATTTLGTPDAPTGLTVSSVSTTSLTLSWTDASSNETSFVVKYGTDNSTFGTTVTTTASGVTSAGITGLIPNTQYYLIVVATNGSGSGTSVSTNTTTIPVVPSSISASANSASSITVTWVDSVNPSGSSYQLSYSDGTVIGTTSNKTYAVTGLTASTSYTFKVRTQYSGNTSVYTAYTDTVSVSTLAEAEGDSSESTPTTNGGAVSLPPPQPTIPNATAVRIPMGQTQIVSLQESKSADIFMYLGSRAVFWVQPSGASTMEEHSVTIVDADLFANTIQVEVASTPKKYTLSLGQTADLDLNEDQIDDVRVTFLNVRLNEVEWSLTTLPLGESSCPLPLNRAYKSPSSPSVYYVSQAHHADGSVDTSIPCTKRAFTTSQKFFTYFTNWNQVVPTTESVLKSIPLDPLGFMPEGPLYDPQYGALVKIVADPKVYLLLGGNKYWITSEAVFTGLKYSWSWIEGVADELLNKYITKEEITYTDHHPNYTLVKYQSSPKVYRLESHPTDSTKQVKRHVTDEATFRALHFRWDRIVTIDETETYETGAPLTTPSNATTSSPATPASQPQTSFTSFLSLGSTGSEVLLLQQTLQSLGFFPTNITPNGNFGPATESAVRAFQTAHSIAPLGYVGPGTREVLNGLL
jgi:hypothetical protein